MHHLTQTKVQASDTAILTSLHISRQFIIYQHSNYAEILSYQMKMSDVFYIFSLILYYLNAMLHKKPTSMACCNLTSAGSCWRYTFMFSIRT